MNPISSALAISTTPHGITRDRLSRMQYEPIAVCTVSVATRTPPLYVNSAMVDEARRREASREKDEMFGGKYAAIPRPMKKSNEVL